MSSSASSTIFRRESVYDISGSVYLISSDGRVLNLPIPTNSDDDPLNWSLRKRAGAFLAILVFSAVGLTIVQAPCLMSPTLARDFTSKDMGPFPLVTLCVSPTLFMGVGAFLWIPLSLAVGRRPVFLLSILIMTISTIWAWAAGSFYQLLVAVSLQGLSEGMNTSTALLMAIDLTFIHQRPQVIAMIWSVVGAVSLSVLAIAPQITSGVIEWRSFYLYAIGPCCLSLFLAFFLYPETYFIRPAVAFDGRILAQSSTEKIQVYEDWAEVPGGKALPDDPGQPIWKRTVKKLLVWRVTRGGWPAMLACYPQAFLCALNPLVFWVALLEALVFGSMLSIGETYTIVLTAEPYNLSPREIGLINIAGALGSLLAWPASGVLIGIVSRRLAERNNGVRDAEHYLPAFILPVITGVLSVVIYGIAAERKWHYIWIYLSNGLSAFCFASLATANTLWVTEAFPRWAAPALVVVGGLSYIASFGLSFAILPWVKSQGYAGANIEIGVMIVIVGCIGIPFSFWGKRMRQYIDGKWAVHEEGALRPQVGRR